MKNMKKMLFLFLLLSAGSSAIADGQKLTTSASNMRREIRKHLTAPSWMTKEMKREKIYLVFTLDENGKPQLKKISGENEKLCRYVRETFSSMKFDTAAKLDETEYKISLDFEVR